MSDTIGTGAENTNDVAGQENTSGAADAGDSGADESDSHSPAWWQFDSKEKAEEWANGVVTRRLARERKKYERIEQEHAKLKTEVEELRPLKEATFTDAQRWEEKFKAQETELEELRQFKASRERDDLVREIAREKGLSDRYLSRVRGDDADSIAADIDDLLNVLSEDGRVAQKQPPKQRAPKEPSNSKGRKLFQGGGHEDEDDFDPKKLAESIPRYGNAPFIRR